MFSKLIQNDLPQQKTVPKEGDLYKVVNTYGRTFELRYGYYGECDRKYDPDVIYPDFIKEPVYTDEGEPFVTLMQDACENYEPSGKSTDRDCGTCAYTERGDDLIGICKCEKNKKININN